MPTPRWWTGSPVTSRSPNQTRPESGTTKPASMRRSVVLPHPDGPSSVKNCPDGISRSSPVKSACPSYAWLTPSKRMRMRLLGRQFLPGLYEGGLIGGGLHVVDRRDLECVDARKAHGRRVH